MFKAKREKQRKIAEQEKWDRQEDQKFLMWLEVQQEHQKVQDFIDYVRLHCGDNVICLEPEDYIEKAFAMGYLFDNGYLCVQNDFGDGKYFLTFAKEEIASKFVCIK